MATGTERAVEGGGEAGNVCGDVGQDTWCGLVVVGDLKQNTTSNCIALTDCARMYAL